MSGAPRILGATAAGVVLFVLLVPVPELDAPLSTVLLDREGRLLGATLADDGQWRFGASDEVPVRFARAVVVYEDRRFYWHPGFDPLALARAAADNLRAGRVVSGGSTLTMQVVRLSRGNRPRTYFEKAIEIVLAVRLELAADKDAILTRYAAYAPFGGNVVGLEAASWRYFGRPPERLSWGEAAALAVLPNNPALVHPGRNRSRLRAKRDHLIARMVDRGVIDEAAGELARAEPLPSAPRRLPRAAPHLLARARAEGLRGRVTSTVERGAQLRAARVVAGHGARLRGMGVNNAAAVVAEVDTGRVLAYVGNIGDPRRGREGTWVDVVTAPRSTGSTLKPFLYAAMLDAGEVLPGQLVPDIPTRIGGFAPENYDQTFAGAVPAATALARSLNVPAVRMLRAHGVGRFHRTLRRLGLTTLHRSADGYGLTLILGGAEATLWDLTGMYAGMARTVNRFAGHRGAAPVPAPLTYRWDTEERGGERPLSQDPGACYETLRALLEVERPGVERSWRRFASSRKIAWKTGTSYGHRDAWAIGVTAGHVVGVWVGNADGEGRRGLSGSSAAAPILFDVFDTLGPSGWFAVPEARMAEIEVCAASGMRAVAACGERRRVMVPVTALPGRRCPYCRVVHLDREGRRVHGGCESPGRMRNVGRFVLPPTVEWYYRRAHADYRPLPALRDDCRSAASRGEPDLSCVHPADGSRIYVPVELDGRVGRVVFRAAHRRPDTRVFWHLDANYVGETSGIHRLALAPSPGPHTVRLVDEHGEELEVRFTVLTRGE